MNRARWVVKLALHSIRENNRAVAVDDGAVVHVKADSLGDRDPLAVAAEADEIGGGVKVVHALDLLLDDRSGVEVGSDVVAGGTDQFHAAGIRLLVGVCADEGWQETVVDVDNAPGEVTAEVVGEDLHESSEDDELDVLFGDEGADSFEAGFAGVAVHRDFVKWQVGPFRDRPAIAAVADDRGDLDREFVKPRPPEDFVEAVVGFGDEHGSFHAVRQAAEVPIGLERSPEGAEPGDEILGIDIEFLGLNFQAGEKFAAELVGELSELDEVAAMAGDVIGDLGNDAGLVWAAEFEDEAGAGHGLRA